MALRAALSAGNAAFASSHVARVLTAMEGAQRRGVPEWAEVDREACSGRIKLMPARSDVTMPINEKLVVELYSK